ncbi:MAG: YebC/PmpR family DNA-binding transcriptional regulator [Christensenellales bacterium]|jgi:YebC/PmpR family DNA-binding regulatory protein
MSGHSKWSNIKIKKGKMDAKKGNIFTKIGREISVAVKQGGPDPNSNSRLRDAIAKAKENNMPGDNIARSIKKASGEADTDNFEEITYEGYGPGGAAVMVFSLTDNKNRTAGEVRHAFDKYGGSLGASGCVSYMFRKKGVILVDKTADEEQLMLTALDAGAEDIVEKDELFEVYADPSSLTAVVNAIVDAGIEVLNSEVAMVSDSEVELEEKHIPNFIKLLDKLEENDDVQDVVHNAIYDEGESEQ